MLHDEGDNLIEGAEGMGVVELEDGVLESGGLDHN